MTDSLDPNWLPTSQLRSIRCTQLAHSEKLGRLAGELSTLRQEVHLVVRHLLDRATHPGPTPSSTSTAPHPPQSPTPGTPSSTPSSALMKQARALGEWVGLAGKVVGLIKVVGVILPSLWLALMAVWKLALPHLSRLLQGL